jgi:hypothetical protein
MSPFEVEAHGCMRTAKDVMHSEDMKKKKKMFVEFLISLGSANKKEGGA